MRHDRRSRRGFTGGDGGDRVLAHRGATAAPEARRLTHRIQGLVSGLVAAQNDDGGWPWVNGRPRPAQEQGQASAASDRQTSAAVVWCSQRPSRWGS